MAGIVNQNAYTSALPNFRNLGILARILVIVNLAVLLGAVFSTASPGTAWRKFVDMSVVVQPVLILSLLALMLLHGLLRRMPYALGATAVVLLELAIVTAVHGIGRPLIGLDTGPLERLWVLTLGLTLTLLVYFDLRGRALSPALSEARLQALQARIRPHFLFNSINAVLSLVRKDPQRAERALEDLADLFRVLMADNRDLTPLAREVDLCREYLNIEQLRLGERLKIDWHIDKMPRDALVPPLVLQPLLENAVYHGIEPRVEPGVVSINIYAAREQVHAVLRNPYEREGNHHAGNKMAIGNIRERLALHFDAEATLDARVRDNTYEVHITIPYVRRRG